MDSENMYENINTIMNSEEKTNYKEINDYVLTKVIGKGTFGIVYSGFRKDNPNKTVAIKRYFRNLHPNISHLEIAILSYINKNIPDDNILKINDGFIIQDEIFLVLSYIEGKKFIDFFTDFSLLEIKKYLYSLLCCLDNIHKVGIIHRDIKPDNFLYDPGSNQFMLIDFGLSEIELNDDHKINLLTRINKNTSEIDPDLKTILEVQKVNGYKHRIGTRGFLAPEIIFNSKYQTKAVDIWSAGVIFLSFLIKRMPVFNMNKFSKLTDETLKEIIPLIIVYGYKKIHNIAQKFNSVIYIPDIFDKYTLKNDYESMIKRDDVDEDCLDLLRSMMELDPEKRITAEDAKNHKFFNDLLSSSVN